MLDPCRAPPPPDRVPDRRAAPPGRAAAPAGLVVLRRSQALQGRSDSHPPNGAEAAVRSDLHPGHRLCRTRRARTHANKDELLLVLDRPEIPLHTNGSETAVRSFVTKRRISGDSAAGKQARDTFLSLLKTCSKLAISFWDYLGARLKIPDADIVPWLPDLIRQNASG